MALTSLLCQEKMGSGIVKAFQSPIQCGDLREVFIMRKTVCFMILVIVSVFFVSACGQVDQEKQCEHEWTPADCLTPKTCSKCGITEGTALGHDEVKDPAEEATLFENGKTEGSHCGR